MRLPILSEKENHRKNLAYTRDFWKNLRIFRTLEEICQPCFSCCKLHFFFYSCRAFFIHMYCNSICFICSFQHFCWHICPFTALKLQIVFYNMLIVWLSVKIKNKINSVKNKIWWFSRMFIGKRSFHSNFTL